MIKRFSQLWALSKGPRGLKAWAFSIPDKTQGCENICLANGALVEKLQGAAQRGAQFYFVFTVLRTPFSCSDMSLFSLKTCTPLKATPTPCANFMDAWKNAFFLQEKPMKPKNSSFFWGGGGVFWVFFWGGGGWSADFIFMGAQIFLTKLRVAKTFVWQTVLLLETFWGKTRRGNRTEGLQEENLLSRKIHW